MLNPVDRDVPHVTGAVARGIEINHSSGRGIFRVIEQLQPNAGCVAAEERKVHAFALRMGSERRRNTNANSGVA
jgi:hypothetical protein